MAVEEGYELSLSTYNDTLKGMEGKRTSMFQAIEDLITVNQNLKVDWEGSSQVAFEQKFGKALTDMRDVAEQLKQLEIVLTNYLDAILADDDAASSIIGSIG